MKKKDFEQSKDQRGDEAVFIEARHFINGELDETAKKYIQINFKNETFFFRVIRDGVQQGSHGWIENGEIFQWG